MKDNLKDILSHLNPDIDQETLLLYLQGKLSAEDQHNIEKKMLDNEFNVDALEGLEHFKNKKNIEAIVAQINSELKKKTEKKKKAREKKNLSVDPWMVIAVIILLALVVISFIIIKKAGS